MRQILVLGLLAVLGWWLYGEYYATPASASGGGGDDLPAADGGASTGGAKPLTDMLPKAQSPTPTPTNGEGQPAGGANPGAKGAALDADGQAALNELVARISALDAEAIAVGWRALAAGSFAANVQQRVADALAGGDGAADIETQLRRLGDANAFLHSARGRAQAEQVLATIKTLDDAAATAAGTRLLDIGLRGRIEQADGAARAFIDRAYQAHRIVAERWLCDPGNVAGARSYTIASGDSLNHIARKFRRDGLMVEEGTLAVLNRIHNKNSIRAGQRIKVPVDPVHAIVEKRSYSLAVYVGKHLLRLYWIGHGINDKTPVTVFTVGAKKPQPPWTAPDGIVYPYGHHKNILGEYWIQMSHEFKTGFGAHGTPEPETICTQSSDGCIRMFGPDIAEFFEIIPRGATIEVRASEAK